MSINILAGNERVLKRGAAMILLAGLVAGCSGGVSRFNGVDDVFTASTANQRQIFNQNQPYPGESQIAAAPVESVQRGDVGRSSLPPVSSQPLPAPQAPAAPRIADAPAPVAPAPAMTARAPVSAPDGNLKMAEAKTVTGTRQDTLSHKAPLPSAAPAIPHQTKVAEAKAVAVGSAQGAYTVQQGDTLSSISRKTGIGVSALQAANGLQDGNIRIGQSLRIPSAGTTTVAAVASASPAAPAKAAVLAADPVVTGTATTAAAPKAEKVAAYTPPKKAEKVIEQAEEYAAAAPDSTGIGRMRWPVRGRVISAFGKGSGKANDGIDIQVPEGTPVKAAENGVVIYAGDGLKEFGNTVLVRHENGLVTVYGHASELKVSRGDKVKRGQQIASSGMSGVADSPRLHFEVRKNSAPVDPTTFLE
ncbi:LysM peptidoglycan-binding domain-containing protein [Pseudaminobacter arsenicus]|uniref:LysM peptidoglycan-binding domain-containing protein n=1 Tax=Borborobacter arsenicus TaxID=1851146 RepID=A0A432V933_9HYPH|nr:M23 family metallopeptidase [Pseudaminobacter arsenicus]RUM98692.1 LysM peptidoglycan-binding domain-containing protein [Pseudaminobacter arsenicus]